MAITYVIDGEVGKIVAGLKAKISSQGGRVEGDEAEGGFTVMGFEGAYTAGDSSVELTITKKPMMIPDSMILAWLKENTR